MTTPRTLDRTGKRQRLIEAAAAVFARQGYSRSRVAAIAAEAGVGKGTVYEYFTSKEELFFAVFEAIHLDAREHVAAELRPATGALERLRAMLAAAAEFLAGHREMHGVTVEFWAASIGSPHEDRFEQVCDRMYRDWRTLAADSIRAGQTAGEIAPDVDADAVATMLVGALDGLGVQFWFDHGIDPRATTARFVDAIETGLAARREPAPASPQPAERRREC